MTKDLLLYATTTFSGPPGQANACCCNLSQLRLEKDDVYTESTSQEMLNILIENNELSGQKKKKNPTKVCRKLKLLLEDLRENFKSHSIYLSIKNNDILSYFND